MTATTSVVLHIVSIIIDGRGKQYYHIIDPVLFSNTFHVDVAVCRLTQQRQMLLGLLQFPIKLCCNVLYDFVAFTIDTDMRMHVVHEGWIEMEQFIKIDTSVGSHMM